MINNSQEFIQRMIELNELYEDVKLIIILSENFDNENKTRISITLELRNALDHILRSISESNDLNKEIQDAKDHIIRAGYDAYEIASISVCNRIIKDISKYDSAIISTVFPDYYHVIKPLIAKIQIELAEIRAGRINVNGNNNLKEYGKKVKVLIEKFEEVQFQIPELEIKR
jgi:hypothetical protein